MKMVDCKGVENKQQLHKRLAEALSFPDYYGNNLDALFDCLMDMRQETVIHLEGWETLAQWKDGFTQTFMDAAQENPHLQVIFA